MKKLLLIALMSAWTAAAAPYDSSSGPLPITGDMMIARSSGTPTTVTGTGSAWSLNVADEGWSEGFAYTIFQVTPNTRVQITSGILQNTITDGGQGWYWGDLVIFASAVHPDDAIAGRVPGPTGSPPAPGVMAWMSDSQYGDPANFLTKAAANDAGYRYFGAVDGYSSYREATGGYSANVENFRDGGLAINGGAYAGWNEVSSTSMAAGTPARPLAEIIYPPGGGLDRALKDQTYSFNGAVHTPTGPGDKYVTLMVRGGGGGSGAIHVNNLVVSFSTSSSVHLSIARQASKVLLSWPGDSPGVYVEETEAVQPANTVWTAVTNVLPALVNNVWSLPQPVTAGARYYRLRLH